MDCLPLYVPVFTESKKFHKVPSFTHSSSLISSFIRAAAFFLTTRLHFLSRGSWLLSSITCHKIVAQTSYWWLLYVPFKFHVSLSPRYRHRFSLAYLLDFLCVCNPSQKFPSALFQGHTAHLHGVSNGLNMSHLLLIFSGEIKRKRNSR